MMNRTRLALITGLVIVVDQATKWLAVQQTSVLLNTSGLWHDVVPWLSHHWAALFTLVVLIGVTRFAWETLVRFPLGGGLFLGGGLSNILDRLMYNGVRDWAPLPFTSIVNNLADWSIAVGLFILLARVHYAESD